MEMGSSQYKRKARLKKIVTLCKIKFPDCQNASILQKDNVQNCHLERQFAKGLSATTISKNYKNNPEEKFAKKKQIGK